MTKCSRKPIRVNILSRVLSLPQGKRHPQKLSLKRGSLMATLKFIEEQPLGEGIACYGAIVVARMYGI